MKRIWCVLLALLAVLAPQRASAQVEPKLTASLDPPSVEVGEPCTVVLTVSVDAGSAAPSDPSLLLPPGVRGSSPRISTQTQLSIVNGRISRTTGISATWQILAPQEGVYVVGPASVAWNGQRLTARLPRLTVHAAGSGRPRARPRATNPFDPFGMFPKLPGFFDAPDPFEQPPPEAPADPELALDFAPDPRLFLRAVVDKAAPVVGEQVTLTVYLYMRVTALEVAESHDPSIPDFFRRDLLTPHTQPDPRAVSIRGVPWRVQPVYKAALFPLRSGDLDIGPMEATYVGRGLASGAERRASDPIKLRVSEPPVAGRPVGYQIGDVGSYTLTANVDPRTVDLGGAIAVSITLSGVGNVPTTVRAPSSSSFEWLEPETREKIDIDGGQVKGSRSFTYVVRPKAAGDLDFGQVTLPYWNPALRTYDVAKATLGRVRVNAGPAPSASAAAAAAPRDPWSALGPVRTHLGAYPRARAPLTDKPWYWMALLGAPFAVVVGALGERGARRLYAGTLARRVSRKRAVETALDEARSADRRNATAELSGALDRALHLAIEEATGLKARAILIAEVARALEARGIPPELARECGELLEAIDGARFLPDQGGSLHGFLPRVERIARALLAARVSASAPPAPTEVSRAPSGGR